MGSNPVEVLNFSFFGGGEGVNFQYCWNNAYSYDVHIFDFIYLHGSEIFDFSDLTALNKVLS